MIKSYDYILGNGKFINLFDIITGVIICSAISFCLTETLFSFNFKLSFQKVLIFTILFLLLLLLFYYFIKQRRYKLLDDKIVFGFRKKEILYRNINSLVFTLTYRPKGQYDIGLGEPYLYVKEHGTKKYICNIFRVARNRSIPTKCEYPCQTQCTGSGIDHAQHNCHNRRQNQQRHNITLRVAILPVRNDI